MLQSSTITWITVTPSNYGIRVYTDDLTVEPVNTAITLYIKGYIDDSIYHYEAFTVTLVNCIVTSITPGATTPSVDSSGTNPFNYEIFTGP